MHKLHKLRDRLTPEQEAARREQLHKAGTWREEMEVQHAQTRSITAQAFRTTTANIVNLRRLFLIGAVVFGVLYIGLVGLALGMW